MARSFSSATGRCRSRGVRLVASGGALVAAQEVGHVDVALGDLELAPLAVLETADAAAARPVADLDRPARECLEALEAGGDHRDPDLIAHRRVDHGAED